MSLGNFSNSKKLKRPKKVKSVNISKGSITIRILILELRNYFAIKNDKIN